MSLRPPWSKGLFLSGEFQGYRSRLPKSSLGIIPILYPGGGRKKNRFALSCVIENISKQERREIENENMLEVPGGLEI
jgi:hypothetical protein